MGRVITFMNQKGGVSKTTSAVTMAYCLDKKGYSVLFIDIDAQSNASVNLLTTPVYQKVRHNNIMDFIEGKKSFEEIVQKVRNTKIDIIPSTLGLSFAEMDWMRKLTRESLLKKVLAPVKDRYDFIIIDTAPHIQLLGLNALVASDDIIVPYLADTFSLEGIKLVREALDSIEENKLNDDVAIEGLLLTRYEPTRINSYIGENIERLVKSYNVRHMYKTYIRKTTKVPESISEEVGLLEFAPDCTAAIDYMNFTNEYLSFNGYPEIKED